MSVRYQFAQRRAAELIAAAKIKAPPVNLSKISRYLRAEIRREPFSGDLSGMVHRKKNGTALIGINSSHPKVRQRFTLAHEIGHLVLHSEEDFHIDERAPFAFRDQNSSLATDDREIEANQFAAALLMPETFICNDVGELSKYQSAEEIIEELADKYDVSIQAMSIRLSKLKLLV